MSPQPTRPLNDPAPPPDLPQLKRRAKELLHAYRQGNPEAVRTVDAHFDGADPERFRLAQAQLVLARATGFPSWTRLRAAASPERAGRRTPGPRSRPLEMHGTNYVYDVDPVDGDQAWALFEACREGDVATVRSLLQTDANLVHAQSWYTQPVHFAVYANQEECLRILLDAGAEPGRSRFMYDSWAELLEHSRQPGFEGCHRVLASTLRDRFGYDAAFARLESAIRRRRPAEVEATLTAQPDLLHACDAFGNNVIHWAVLTRQPELFPLFAGRGADFDHRRSDGQTPAHVLINGDYAFRTRRELKGLEYPDQPAVAQALRSAGASYDLSLACATGDGAHVDTVLAADPDAARRLDSGRRSPLMYAARSGHLALVRTLLEHGADPNMPEELAPDGHALFAASENRHLDIVKLLLEYGANPNAESDSSGSCLTAAQHWGNAGKPIVALLREHGARTPAYILTVDEFRYALDHDLPDCKDPYFALEALARNDVALTELVLKKDPDVVRRLHGGNLRLESADVAITESAVLMLLLDAGFDPTRADWLGKTPLHHFAGRGEVGNALLMIEHGADIDAIDDRYHGTPLAWAAAAGHLEAVCLLLDHGADPEVPRDRPHARPLARARSGDHDAIVTTLSERRPDKGPARGA